MVLNESIETNKGSKSKPRIVSGQASCSLGLELWRKHKKESEIVAFSSMPSSHPSPILIYTVLDLGREVWNKHKNYRLKAHYEAGAEEALEAIKPDETAFLSPDPCCSGLLVYRATLDLSILVYPSYCYQGDTAETQILLQHHFCLKFFWDSFCLQEKLKLLCSTFKATRPPSPFS